MTFYIRIAFTSGLALRIKGAAYFTESQPSETDNSVETPDSAEAQRGRGKGLAGPMMRISCYAAPRQVSLRTQFGAQA
jgi:hypothetical protein